MLYSAGFVALRSMDGTYMPGGRWYGKPTGCDLAGIAKVSPAPPLGTWVFGWSSLSYIGSLNTAYNVSLRVRQDAVLSQWLALRGVPKSMVKSSVTHLSQTHSPAPNRPT